MTEAKYLIIINPAARHGETAKLVPVITELFASLPRHTIVQSVEPLHARALAEASDADVIVAAGGDGTVHEVLNGIMSHPRESRPALALIPTGSGNDYRRTLGVSTDLAAAVRQVLTGERRSVDVGLANGTWFANSVAMGLDARVTAKAVELKVTTRMSGLPLYGAALMHVLFREFYSHDLRVQFDDEPAFDTDLLLMAVTNGPTYGGGFRITPDSDPADGVFDVITIDPLSLGSALWKLPFVVTGHHGWLRQVRFSRRRRIRVWSETPLPGQIDGEVTMANHYDIEMHAGSLDVIAPRR